MKKFFLFILTFLLSLSLYSCGKNINFKDYISEITYVYFRGFSQSAKASISVGQREEPYVIDGKNQKLCDFSLISIEFEQIINENEINATVQINDNISYERLFFNPVTNSFMCDLGYCIKEDSSVKISYQDIVIALENVSENFEIDYQKALDLSGEKLSKEIESLKENGEFKGECYLKILTLKGEEDRLFWNFTLVDINNKTYNLLIDASSGEIISFN